MPNGYDLRDDNRCGWETENDLAGRKELMPR